MRVVVIADDLVAPGAWAAGVNRKDRVVVAAVGIQRYHPSTRDSEAVPDIGPGGDAVCRPVGRGRDRAAVDPAILGHTRSAQGQGGGVGAGVVEGRRGGGAAEVQVVNIPRVVVEIDLEVEF